MLLSRSAGNRPVHLLWPSLLLPALLAAVPAAQRTAVSPADGAALDAPPTLPDAAPVGDGPARILTWFDADGDGQQDVVGVDAEGELRLFLNRFGASFVDAGDTAGLTTLGKPHAAVGRDYDGDEQLDLLVLTDEFRIHVFRNQGAGQFDDVTSALGIRADERTHHAQWIDLDTDRFPDLLVASGDRAAVYRNVGGSYFERAELPATPVVLPTTGADSGAPLGTVRGAADRNSIGASSNGVAIAPAGDRDRAAPSGATSGTTTGGQVASTGAPVGPLQASSLTCALTLKDAETGACLTASSEPGLGQLYPLSEDLYVATDGFVGVGTTAPAGNLHVMGNASLAKLVVSTDLDFLFGGNAELWLGGDKDADAAMIHRYDASAGTYRLQSQIGGLEYGPYLTINQITEEVGIGATVPAANLHVAGSGSLGTLMISPGNAGTSNQSSQLFFTEEDNGDIGMRLAYDGGGNQLQVYGEVNGTTYGPHLSIERSNGRVGIGTDAPVAMLDVAGSCRVQALDIVAGADVVEGFMTSDGFAEPGTVLVIDADSPGALRQSCEAYDARVAGVVSGAGGVNPGLRLGQPGVDGDTPLAMAGRVWVRCTTDDGGPIRAGDRLTTASLRGHAMRAADPGRADGAVLGKAMSSLAAGEGLVLTLVNLQ